MDISGQIRNNNEEWFSSSCVKCTCLNGTISCSRYLVNIAYGLFKVDKFAACEQCSDPSQTLERATACEGRRTLCLKLLNYRKKENQ